MLRTVQECHQTEECDLIIRCGKHGHFKYRLEKLKFKIYCSTIYIDLIKFGMTGF